LEGLKVPWATEDRIQRVTADLHDVQQTSEIQYFKSIDKKIDRDICDAGEVVAISISRGHDQEKQVQL
jgi:hypothetical protein